MKSCMQRKMKNTLKIIKRMTKPHFQSLPRLLIALLCITQLSMAKKDIPPCQIRVSSQPAGAAVTCDGSLYENTPLTISNIQPGEHLIILKKHGHHEARRTVRLEQSQKIALDVPLNPVNALLLVHSAPSGANIQIDGADKGQTPTFITDLPLGKYRMRLSAPGYMSKEIDLVLNDRTPISVNVALISDSATLILSSEPVGARVIINGIDKNITPCTIPNITQGNVDLELRMEGYKPYNRLIKLAAGQEETVSAFMEPIPAKLTVISIPPGARIYIDNQFRGESPVIINDVDPGGLCRMRAELAGHDIMVRTITLQNADDKVEEFRLERNSGLLYLTTEPPDVTVTIDEKEIGTTIASTNGTSPVSQTFKVEDLTPGKHTIRLSKKRYFNEEFSIKAEIGEIITKHQKLKREFKPDYEVRTTTDVYKGVLITIDTIGNVKLEIRPGIIKTITAEEIKSRKPLTP